MCVTETGSTKAEIGNSEGNFCPWTACGFLIVMAVAGLLGANENGGAKIGEGAAQLPLQSK